MTNIGSQHPQFSQLQDQLNMLREYSRALEAQNKTRNQERIILEKEIERLSHLDKNNNKSTQCLQCSKYKSDIIKLENQVERLKRENTNLQSSYNVLSETLAKYNMLSNNKPNDHEKTQLEIKYKELSDKYDDINFQNLNLKKEMEEMSRRVQSQSTTDKAVSKLQEQKQALNIRISSLQLQIHNLKYSISTKDNEIFTYKNKQNSQASLESELKLVRQSVQQKDKDLALLRQKLTELTSLQFQLRNLKATVSSKDSEISSLKAQVGKNQQELGKIYKLESEIRNMKYQITSKDTQIQKLKNKSNEVSSSEQSKLSLLQQQLRNTKSICVAKDSELVILKTQVTQMTNLRAKVSSLQNQSRVWKAKYEEQSNQNMVNISISASNTQFSQQIEGLNGEIVKLKAESTDKDNYIKRLEDELKEMTNRDQLKNAEVRKLDSIVSGYVDKIGELEVELNRLERNSLSGSATNIAQTMNNEGLLIQNRTLNQKIEDLQRRILILQDTNKNLREELRVSIEMRSRQSSRLITSPSPIQPINIINTDDQLLKTIKQLKTELDNNRNYNNRMKLDNQYLQAKLSSAELEIQHLIGLSNKGGIGIRIAGDRSLEKERSSNLSVVSSNRVLSNMPAVEVSKTAYDSRGSRSPVPRPQIRKEIKIEHNYTVLDDNERDPGSSLALDVKPMNYRSSEPIYSKGTRQKQSERVVEVTSIGNGSMSRNKYNKVSGSGGWAKSGGDPKQLDYLQKKIEMLKQQNKGLRKNLYQPN